MFLKNSKEAYVSDRLAECRINLNRLNDDSDIDHAKVRSLLNKQFVSFEDELFSTYASLLIIAKKVCDLKARNFELDPWFLQRLDIASEYTFAVFNYLSVENVQALDKFTIEFYREPETNIKPVFDIRDKLNKDREVTLS